MWYKSVLTHGVGMTATLLLGMFLASPNAFSPASAAQQKERATQPRAPKHVDNPIVISVEVREGDLEKTVKFYSEMYGIPFARSLTDVRKSYHAPVSETGLYLQISASDTHRGVTVQSRVSDLEKALANIKAYGGTVKAQFDMPMAPKALPAYRQAVSICSEAHAAAIPKGEKVSLGKGAVALDPAGNRIGLIQLEYHATHFFTDKPPSKDRLELHKLSIANGEAMTK
jgi:predicted enzyme related to lactoylglutathione lyase